MCYPPRLYEHVFHSPSSADLLTSAAAARAALRCKEWRGEPLIRSTVSQSELGSGSAIKVYTLHYGEGKVDVRWIFRQLSKSQIHSRLQVHSGKLSYRRGLEIFMSDGFAAASSLGNSSRTKAFRIFPPALFVRLYTWQSSECLLPL